MPAIQHILYVNAPMKEVYHAIQQVEGLRKWWTVQVTGDPDIEGKLVFTFGTHWFVCMEVLALNPFEKIIWNCVDEGGTEWLNTEITFHLDKEEGMTRVQFDHEGWKEETDLFAQCKTDWAKYLDSLKKLCETGVGHPFHSE